MRCNVGAEPKEALLTLNFPGISTQREQQLRKQAIHDWILSDGQGEAHSRPPLPPWAAGDTEKGARPHGVGVGGRSIPPQPGRQVTVPTPHWVGQSHLKARRQLSLLF